MKKIWKEKKMISLKYLRESIRKGKAFFRGEKVIGYDNGMAFTIPMKDSEFWFREHPLIANVYIISPESISLPIRIKI